MSAGDRYDRQRRIRGWRQHRLRDSRVLVAGAGALGNEVLKNLALMGVGRIVVVDFDRIERSNLSRTVLFREQDIGGSKASVAAARAAELNPEIRVSPIDGDLFLDVGLGLYRHANLVIGGLDNLAARVRASHCAQLAGVPYLDGGMWAMGGEVRWFMPGEGPCFACTLTDQDRRRLTERRPCSGFNGPADGSEEPFPSTIGTTAVVGGMLAMEAARFLCDWPAARGMAIVYNGLEPSLHQSTLARDPGCRNHEPYGQIVELKRRAAETTAGDLLALAAGKLGAGAVLELGRDFLLEFRCPACGRSERVGRLLARVRETERVCSRCRAAREPVVVSRVAAGSPLARRTLSELGVPAGEILAVHSPAGLDLFELTGDVAHAWQG